MVYLQPLNYHNDDLDEDAKTNTYNKVHANFNMTGNDASAYERVYDTSVYVRRSDGYEEQVPNIANWDGNQQARWFNTGTLNGAVSLSFNISVEVADLDASELHFFYDSGLEFDVHIRDYQGNIVKTCKAIAVSDVTTVDLSTYDYVFKFDKWTNFQSIHQFRIYLPFTVVVRVNAALYGTQFSADVEGKWRIDPLTPGGTVHRDTPLYCDDKGTESFYTDSLFYVNTSQPMTIKYQNLIRSGAQYHLSDLWDHTKSPWNIILDYMKIFRMMIYVDKTQVMEDGQIVNKQVVRFIPSTKYFRNPQIEDWSDKLDMTKDFTVKPVYWGSRNVLFNTESNESKIGKSYKERYGVEYGEKKIITDYKFDTNTTNLFDEPIKTTIMTTDNVLSWTSTYDLGAISYTRSSMEVFPHFADEDNKLVNPFGSFAFCLGNAMWDNGGHLRAVCLSDDTVNQVSEGKYYYSQSSDPDCYLLSNGYPKVDIKKWRNVFTFGKPLQNYSLSDYTDTKDIYESFWQLYINERYNVQSKMVTCYLDIKPVDFLNFTFNKFIKIGNQLYFVNKIYDYDIMSSATTKCDLITVRDLSAYYTDQYEYIDGKLRSNTTFAGDSFEIDVEVNGNGAWAVESPGVFDPVPQSGQGSATITVATNQSTPSGNYTLRLYRTDSPYSSMQDKEHIDITVTVITRQEPSFLKMTAVQPTTLSFSNSDSDLQYSTDGQSWTDYALNTITLNTNDKVYWRRNATTVLHRNLGNFYINNGSIDLAGNIMSLLSSNYEEMTDLTGWGDSSSVNTGIFSTLFQHCHVRNADDLVMPAITLSPYCYYEMFHDTTLVSAAFELPATTLAEGCYNSMFADCNSLTNIQSILPATTLAVSCYDSMYGACISITEAPELPATTLQTGCYAAMFLSCTSLTSAPVLPATTLVD